MTAVDLALLGLAAAFLTGLARLAIGPSVADRAVAADLCFYAAIGALALLAVKLESATFVDAVLVAALLGFVATLALARQVGKP